jgi:hypothetical protein
MWRLLGSRAEEFGQGAAGGRRDFLSPTGRVRVACHTISKRFQKPNKRERQMKHTLLAVLGGAALLAASVGASSAGTLDDVKAKGFVQCGVNTGLPGFGNPDSTGKYTGFDVDYCRAVSAPVGRS